jgi:hypothetical protein
MSESDRTEPAGWVTAAGPDDSAPAPLTLTAWAERHAPNLSEVSNSNPNATLLSHNLVAITDDTEAARVIALDFERVTPDDNDTTMLVLGHAVSREEHAEVDPEGVTTHAARRIALGGIPGAVICSLLIGLGVWLITEHAAATAGAAIGGAIFGFYVTSVWSFVIGTGDSEAYQQGFIDPKAADAIVVALHSEDPAVLAEARRTVSSEEKVRLFELDERGRQIG